MKVKTLLIYLVSAFLCCSGNLYAQDEKLYSYQELDNKPQFQGGDLNSFALWVHKNVTYPPIARDNGIQGRVIIQFTVGADGSIRDVKAIRSVDITLDKEAVRVVKSSPQWTPAQKDGNAVATRVNIPVLFRLQ